MTAGPCTRCKTQSECAERGCAYGETVAEPDLFGMSLTRYTVIGKGAFPIDLLRQGLAWPARTSDSRRICEGSDSTERTVEIQGMRPPNFRNWLASSWRIVEINGVNT